MKKQCIHCHKHKLVQLFGLDNSSKDKRHAYCRPCTQIIRRLYRKNNPQKDAQSYRRWWLKARYGLSEKQFTAMLVLQKHRCACCGGKASKMGFHVDHDHITKKVRALLCTWCNVGLGNFSDSTEKLQQAIWYLRRYA